VAYNTLLHFVVLVNFHFNFTCQHKIFAFFNKELYGNLQNKIIFMNYLMLKEMIINLFNN